MPNLVPNIPQAQAILRCLASFLTSSAFAFSLRLGNMVDPHKILAFLMLPFSSAFDPSLMFLAASALLYRYALVEQPMLGGKFNVPTSTKIDLRLVLGSVIFGIGWGIGGICRTSIVGLGQWAVAFQTHFLFQLDLLWSISDVLCTLALGLWRTQVGLYRWFSVACWLSEDQCRIGYWGLLMEDFAASQLHQSHFFFFC